jgi:hypothetical protein
MQKSVAGKQTDFIAAIVSNFKPNFIPLLKRHFDIKKTVKRLEFMLFQPIIALYRAKNRSEEHHEA